MFQEWETTLLRAASFYDGPVEPEVGEDRRQRIFEYQVEDWEMNAVDGSGPGDPISLTDVKGNKAAKFRLQEKYKGLHFVHKDPNAGTTYYSPDIDPDNRGPPKPQSEWEHRKLIGLINMGKPQ